MTELVVRGSWLVAGGWWLVVRGSLKNLALFFCDCSYETLLILFRLRVLYFSLCALRVNALTPVIGRLLSPSSES